MKLLVVVCHFKEDLNWLKKLKYPYIVYNKNPLENNKFEINTPNVGYDAETYLRYIIDNYKTLPDFVCFSQDDPMYHCSNIIEEINSFDFKKDFFPLGKVFIRESEEILGHVFKYAEKTGIKYTLPIKFVAGTQCIVSRKLILKNDIEFYQRFKDTLSKSEVKTYTNYLVEYLWPTILSFNDELQVTKS